MTARAWNLTLVGLMIGFVILFFGLPIVKIFRNLDYGRKVQTVLLESLRERYSDDSFEKGGVGYEGPSVSIRVVKKMDPERNREIIQHIEEELAQRNIVVDFYLQFSDETIQHAFRKSSQPKKGWFEQ